MDIISKSISEVLFTVPRDILKLAYQNKTFGAAPLSLENEIRNKTIIPRVIVDTNIVGGDTIIINLMDVPAKKIDEYNYVYDIPPEKVNYRTIMTALSVSYMTFNASMNTSLQNMASGTPSGLNSMSSAAHRAFDSRSNIPIISNSECVMVGHNTVLVRNHLITAGGMQLRCVVTNDENLNNLSIRNAPAFSKLCKLAVRSYIYNEMIVKLDRNFLERGQDLGIVRTYIEGLADAEEMYQTFLAEEWSGVGTINDRLTYEDLLRIQMDSSL